jgi:hypothetical protein
LASLDNSYSYFTVCTHDNAPPYWFKLPDKTKFFCGGYYDTDPSLINFKEINSKKYISIPLIVSPSINTGIQNNINSNKKYLASFIGSNSNYLRENLEKIYLNNPKFYIKNKFNPEMKSSSFGELQFFINVSLQSYFILCPRGFSPTSYRLYESLHLKRIPVYISDIFWLPYEDEINWNDICVFIKPEQINSLEEILNEELKSGNYQKKLKYINEISDQYFTFEAIFSKIIEYSQQ